MSYHMSHMLQRKRLLELNDVVTDDGIYFYYNLYTYIIRGGSAEGTARIGTLKWIKDHL